MPCLSVCPSFSLASSLVYPIHVPTLTLPCFSFPTLNLGERDCRLNQLLKEQGRERQPKDSGSSVCWSKHEVLAYAQICPGRSCSQSRAEYNNRGYTYSLKHLRLIITSALIYTSTTVVLRTAWESVVYC